MVVHTCNPRIWVAEAEWEFGVSLGLHRETLPQNEYKKRKEKSGFENPGLLVTGHVIRVRSSPLSFSPPCSKVGLILAAKEQTKLVDGSVLWHFLLPHMSLVAVFTRAWF
jgi:hypothetical protein